MAGDGSSSEMELPPQLVSAAIQRATADSSESENECSNSDTPHQSTTHYASSLLQQFEAQTQLLSSSATITQIGASKSTVSCALTPGPIDGVGTISDCVLGQINNLQDMTPSFLNNSQHLSPQQTEELTQINKDLEEITSESVSITIPNPPSLEDCVDNNDFMPYDITNGGSEIENDILKSSPLTVASIDMTPVCQMDSQKLDTISTNSIESQEDVKVIVTESRRKRGRPRKVKNFKVVESQREDKSGVNVINDYPNNDDPPNVSPDSGILSNHNSPTHSPLRRHDLDVSNDRVNRKVLQKENNIKERANVRSKSRSRRTHNRSDSSEVDYHKKKIENAVKHIKSEAPSPVPLKQEQSKDDKSKRNDHKLDIAALDRMLYATDRVLYPPRKKVVRKPLNKTKSNKTLSRPANDKTQSESADSDDDSAQKRLVLSGVYAKRKELNSKLASLPKKNTKSFSNSWRDNQSENEAVADDPLDPTWKQIDLNPKYKDILSGYKSDHEFKPYKSCSRLMESGYRSDYGCRSGYKSDYYRSGYKSDHRSGYKSDKSGYKTDYSVRSMRRRMRKLKKSRSVRDRSYYKNQKHFVSDQEILLLANKTFSSLTLGHTSSDSECESFLRKPRASPKYTSVCTKYPMSSAKYSFGFSKLTQKHILRYNSTDPFAPGPVFSGLQKPITYNIFKVNHNNNTLLKSPTKINYIGSPLPALKPVFTHKFGSSPICTVVSSKKEFDSNNKNITTKSKKSTKNVSPNLHLKKDGPQKAIANVFEKAKNSYVPNKSLSRNVFLNFRKPTAKPSFQIKKHRRTVVLAPPKINLKPKITERISRISVKTENKHHRHRSKKRHRSRSASRCRESLIKTVDSVDQRFTQDMDSLISNFIKLCQIAPKLIQPITVPKIVEKQSQESVATKIVKRGSKKRKTSDQEISTPTSKRRHKKQLTESQSKGGKDTNEHKLPLKKRHYHINSSTSNSISLSLMSTDFDGCADSKSGTSPDKFLCTETDCLGDLEKDLKEDSPKAKSILNDKKKTENVKVSSQVNSNQENKLQTVDSVTKNAKTGINALNSIDLQTDDKFSSSSKHSTNSSNCTDDELAITKPDADQSELSKKIYETSEKLKAVHKMVHDLEKSLPKSKETEAKNEMLKSENNRTSSPRLEAKSSPLRNSAPIVTPKKRHRLEAEKTVHSNLDQVVQSLSKKLSEEKGNSIICNKSDDSNKEDVKESENTNISTNTGELVNNNNNVVDPLKSMSARSLYKSSIPPAQKSEIMTRKKNRLEGLTSNLVSKINPSAATKVLDTLLNNNIRKSIESRILEKEKNCADVSNKSTEDKTKTSKEPSQINTRATVIKSPVSKGKLLLDAKKVKSCELPMEQTIVVNVDQPTGIFEPSIDLEDQIPKSSICVNILTEKHKSKVRNNDKTSKLLLSSLDTEPDIPLSLISDTTESIINRTKRSESIAAVISGKLQETSGGHNLRQTKRNISNENEELNDKKKKKGNNNIIRESKLVLPSKSLIPKVQAERLAVVETVKKVKEDVEKKDIIVTESKSTENVSKKKTRRRKAINRTGFPNVKKKKKKIEATSNSIGLSDSQVPSEDTDNNSAFERVPKDGEAMSSFLKRTAKRTELKVLLNKEEIPKQGRLTVVALEKLQGKVVVDNNKIGNKTDISGSQFDKKSSSTSILRAPSLQLKQNKNDKDQKNHVNKWEVLSESDSIPSLASSLGNDPEDSIPLSLLNLKSGRGGQLNNMERLKRKTRALSPSHEIEDIMSKRQLVEKNNTIVLRPKSSLAVLCTTEKRLTRSSDNTQEELKNKTSKKLDSKKTTTDSVVNKNITEKSKPASVATRRKSRSCQANKKAREVKSSSRDSSLDTLRGYKQCKSRETSVDTVMKDQDENDPLPLNEKEIDFEKSIDVLSKSVICKKRVVSSRDESPASSVEMYKERDGPRISKRNPRLRKKFLVAGLFSDYYKEE